MNMYRNGFGHGHDCHHHGAYGGHHHPAEHAVAPAAIGWALGFSAGAVVGLIGALAVLTVTGIARTALADQTDDEGGPVAL